MQIQRILLPIDDSPGTQAAIDCAVLLAKALHASLTLVHVDELPSAMVGIVPGATVEGDLATENRAALARLAMLSSDVLAAGVADVETLSITSPSIAAALVDVARRRPFDLIVMGTHARTGMPRLVFGSIAEEVLRHAPCPVVTVHLPVDR